MKQYPSISPEIVCGQNLFGFDKIDGSNIRAEWSKKRGFYKFGTRRRLLDESDSMLGGAKRLFLDKYADELNVRFRQQRWDRAVAFFEFWGPSSFAGSHDPNDSHDVTLFDIALYKKGLVEPREFLRFTEGLDVPSLLHQGQLSLELIDSIKTSILDGMTFEGVVFKYKHPKLGTSVAFKVKSRAWLNRLKEKCGDNHQLFERLK